MNYEDSINPQEEIILAPVQKNMNDIIYFTVNDVKLCVTETKNYIWCYCLI
jgi:hypothetical protein